MGEFIQAGWADSNFTDKNVGKLIVLFHPFQKFMEAESKLRGRPVHKEVVFITKIVPGDKGHVIDRPMREQDMMEFPQEWAAYQNKTQNRVQGIPIEHWPALSDTQKADFKYMNIPTVEHFINLPDSISQKIMGYADLRAKGIAYVQAGKNDELLAEVKKAATQETDELKRQIAELRAILDKQTAPDDGKKKAS